MEDLVVLVSDKNMEYALRGGLNRPEALGIRAIGFQFLSHAGHDGGVRSTGPEVVRSQRRLYRHALVVMDREGCGEEDLSSVQLEQQLDDRLRHVWDGDAKAIVVDPEVDVWLWGAENKLKEILKWQLDQGIREWLRERGFEFSADDKPIRPKEALEALRPVIRRPRSSSLYEQITGSISLARCSDPAFKRLKSQVQAWFPK
jgi:hypothetical protein